MNYHELKKIVDEMYDKCIADPTNYYSIKVPDSQLLDLKAGNAIIVPIDLAESILRDLLTLVP